MVTARSIVALFVAVLAAGCVAKKPALPPAPAAAIDYAGELPAGQLALRKITPDRYPAFSIRQNDPAELARSIDHSLQYLRRPSSRGFFPYLDITHDRAVASLVALRELVTTASPGTTDADLARLIAERFEVYQSVGAPGPGPNGYTDSVLFTAYCTPIHDASMTRGGAYQFPLYARPADLDADPITGVVRGRKLPGGGVVPYYTRKQIEDDGVLAGQELVWLKSRWDAYVITIQGSARLRLPDGQIYEVGYAGANGYEYTSPGRQLLSEGKIAKDQLNLRGLAAYFAQHPDDMPRYLTMNERTVFFAETQGGPYGSLNVPVTGFATIATDKAVYPRAMPGFLVVPIPALSGTGAPYRGFMLDQDTGGAIRAAGRTDIYMGVGPQAEAMAGQQLNPGQLYYVAVKPELVNEYLSRANEAEAAEAH